MKLMIEVEFPDDFTPPERFIGLWDKEKTPCLKCPFMNKKDEFGGNCNYPGTGSECPIRKYFK